MKKYILIAILLIVIDQASKFWVKTTMYLGESINVAGDWFYIQFVENPGMAFSMELGGAYGKIILTLFRIVASVFLVVVIYRLHKQKAPFGLLLSFTMIFAGAVGNVLDSIFYGKLFSSSSGQIAGFMDGNPYGEWFKGNVVDMLYFPLVEGYLPDWLPFWGGDYFIFFSPVFNIADSCVTVGLFLFIIFQGKFFKKEQEQHNAAEIPETETSENPEPSN